MGYSSKKGKRPAEYASKASHGFVINDSTVKEFISKCNLPKPASDIDIDDKYRLKLNTINNNPIKHIIAIDGGNTEVSVQKEYPSATITFFQFGTLFFNIEDLEDLAYKPFIDPEDIQKLKNVERQKLAIPTKNITYKEHNDLTSSVRKALYEFLMNKHDKELLIETLKWFLFEEYDKPKTNFPLARCPYDDCSTFALSLTSANMLKDYTFKCPACKRIIYLTDVFRLHEAIDNELGAGGIIGYLTTTLEQILLVHVFRLILKTKPSLMSEILFIKDGPLGFFGQTANMHKPMRNLTNYLVENHNLYLVGLEKSGMFVEHAQAIEKKLKPREILLLNNDYIYKYVIPGKADPDHPYANTSYYSAKLFFKSNDERMYVATIPVKDKKIVLNPQEGDFHNLHTILANVEKLRCDMYDDSLIPIALVNKLVSLSNHPSSVILEKFAKSSIK
jgi:hypothetical protein